MSDISRIEQFITTYDLFNYQQVYKGLIDLRNNKDPLNRAELVWLVQHLMALWGNTGNNQYTDTAEMVLKYFVRREYI